MNGFNEKIQDPNCREAIFLAVFRGKVVVVIIFLLRLKTALTAVGCGGSGFC